MTLKSWIWKLTVYPAWWSLKRLVVMVIGAILMVAWCQKEVVKTNLMGGLVSENQGQMYAKQRNGGEDNPKVVVAIPEIVPSSSRRLTAGQVWAAARAAATERHLYSESFPWTSVTSALASAKVVRARLFSTLESDIGDVMTNAKSDFGSTHKWILDLDGGQKAVFKPQWYGRDHIPAFWSDGFELHTSEIAAFHLDRILGFRRVPFTSGRRLHVDTELLPVASQAMRQRLLANGSEWCLSELCYFCDTDLTKCSTKQLLEGSMTYLVPGLSSYQTNPWGVNDRLTHRRMSVNSRAHCERIRTSRDFLQQDSGLLDLIDMSVLDHLSHHFDSKLYHVQKGSARGLFIHLDRGRAFTSSSTGDDDLNLLPLLHCCRIRNDTFSTLRRLSKDDNIVTSLREALSSDPVSPPAILTEAHLNAVRTRLKHVLEVIDKCLLLNKPADVLL